MPASGALFPAAASAQGSGDSDIKLKLGDRLSWPEPEPGQRPVSRSQLP